MCTSIERTPPPSSHRLEYAHATAEEEEEEVRKKEEKIRGNPQHLMSEPKKKVFHDVSEESFGLSIYVTNRP